MESFTQIPNWILAKMYRGDFTKRELKVALYLIRKLYGFHKTSDKIPYSQIAEATDLSKRDVIRTVKSLEEKELISVSRKDKCINIIKFKAGGKSTTSRGGKNTTIEVAKTPPSKENQKQPSTGLLFGATLEGKEKPYWEKEIDWNE